MRKIKRLITLCTLCVILLISNISTFAAELPEIKSEISEVSPRLTLQLRPSTTLRKSVIASDYGDLLINIDTTLLGVMTTNDTMTQVLSADSAHVTVNCYLYGFGTKLSNVTTKCTRTNNGTTATFTASFTVTVTNYVAWTKTIPCTITMTTNAAGRILYQSIV